MTRVIKNCTNNFYLLGRGTKKDERMMQVVSLYQEVFMFGCIKRGQNFLRMFDPHFVSKNDLIPIFTFSMLKKSDQKFFFFFFLLLCLPLKERERIGLKNCFGG